MQRTQGAESEEKNNKGLDSATLVTKSNPCLPGSVVGEESMLPLLLTHK
jgi:hypothetical protein